MMVEREPSPYEIIAYSVPNFVGSRVPVAACKAGFQGVLDLEFADLEDPQIQSAVTDFRVAAPGLWGLKLAATNLDKLIASGLLDPSMPKCLVLTGDISDTVPSGVDRLRDASSELRVLVEVVAPGDLQSALTLSPDGLVAKGHETGGRSGDETSFILVQRLMEKTDLPIIAQGGVGPDTVAAFKICGAAGVALDWQLALFEAAQTPDQLARAISRIDGSETFHIAETDTTGYRVFWRMDHKPARALKELADHDRAALPAAVAAGVEPTTGGGVWLVGQDASFARSMLDRYGRVGPALSDLADRATRLAAAARDQDVLRRNSEFAQQLGVEFPIVQGPMTRVSDRAEFAKSVADGGALPFLALALMRGQEATDLVSETKAMLGDQPWGVGILGFVDDALREEQMKIILDQKPTHALIAGGRPEQAHALEKAGIPTFLHVPSPGLLDVFLQQGARRFIFEGRECGGHVGPRSSAVLWQQAVEGLRAFYGTKPMDCQVLFAGGIYDARSAAMVAALSADIVAQGAEVGALMGSAYILTREAVDAGAVVASYQELVVEADETMLLESGVGHATRVVASPIVQGFKDEKAKLIAEGLDPEEIKDRLERFNVGRSRVASKGIDRNPDFGKTDGVPKYIDISPDDQCEQGVYMIGQVAGLMHEATTIADLHASVSDGSGAFLTQAVPVTEPKPEFLPGPGARVALTGMATILPKAPDRDTYWQNILDKVDAVSIVPDRRWDWRRYYDADKTAPDKTYSHWGGFLDEIEFDPIQYGIPPNSMTSIEPLQLLALEVVRKALEDAGFKDGLIPDAELRKRTCVIIGVGGGAAPLGQQYAVRTSMPSVIGELTEDAKTRLPEWTEDSFPGILLNVIAGRVANRFDLGGVNFTVDAACGSSLAAVMTGMREIESGTADMAIVAGVDAFQSPFDFIAFAKTQALSEKGRCRTFDAGADGIAISEGLAALVLRPVEAAEADGDRIYAVVRGVAGASDGRDLSLTAPRPEGQQETLRRAYKRAGISPASVGLVEAHGTGTVVGDRTEIQSLTAVYGPLRDEKQFCGVGSVKSMIGHTKAAAGCAGMTKVALALHHRVQPPTLNVETPSPSANFSESPFYPVVEARPWLRTGDTPRRAGVSAFGFGGTNFHAVLEEYDGGYLPSHQEPFRKAWGHELLLFSADSPAALSAALLKAADGIVGCGHTLRDIAASLAKGFEAEAEARFAIVTPSVEDAATRLRMAANQIDAGGALRDVDPMGAFVSTEAPLTTDQVGFLFPGQGSQYPNMAAGLAMHFPGLREALEASSALLSDDLSAPLADLIYPRPTLDEAEAKAQAKALMQTNVAQPAIGAVSAGMLALLQGMGAKAGAMAGHSFGEFTALCAAGAFGTDTLVRLAHARGDAIIREGGDDLGTMTAVTASESRIRDVIGEAPGITFANFNAPEQTVLAGSAEALDAAEAKLSAAEVSVRRLPVACAFHSDFVAPARERLGEAIAATDITAPKVPVYANESGAAYPNDPEIVADMLTRHLTQPVNFLGAVQQMHDAGVRLFVEVGPNAVLSRLTGRILGDAPHLAVATDVDGRGGVQQFLTALAAMSAAGLQLDLSQLWAQRATPLADVVTWTEKVEEDPRRAMKWMIDPARVRPINGEYARVGLAGRLEDDPKPASAQMGGVAATSAPTSAPAPISPAAPVASVPPTAPQTATPGASVRSVAAPMSPRAPNVTQNTGAASEAMRQHHELMARLLDNHAQTMRMFLGQGSGLTPGQGVGTPVREAAPTSVPALPPSPAPGPSPAPAVAGAAPVPVPPAPVSTPPAVATPEPSAPSVASLPEPEAVAQKLLGLISDRTGYPPDMLGRELNLEADLGIDSIKRVEILASLRLHFLADAGEAAHEMMGPVARERTVDGIVAKFMDVVEAVSGPISAQASTSQASTPQAPTPIVSTQGTAGLRPDPEAVAQKLLDLISDRTGYPPEMLGRDLNLEADLGIDSIKRVEILASLRLHFLADAGEAAHELMGPVARERTVDGIMAKFMEVVDAVFGPTSAAAPVAAPAVQVGGVTSARPDPEAVAQKLLDLISDRTGYPPEMLGRELNLEADLGIDSIKRVEILASLRLHFLADAGEAAHELMGPVARERTVDGILAKFMGVVDAVSTAAPASSAMAVSQSAPMVSASARPDPEAVAQKLLDLISDRTGYPPEMLGRELNLEADLGIDSIKRVEILASLRLHFLADAGEAAHELMGPVARERTVDGILAKFMGVVDAVAQGVPSGDVSASQSAVPAAALAPVGTALVSDGLTRRFVMVRSAVDACPVEDWVTAGALYLLTDDGGGVVQALAAKIAEAGGDTLILSPEGLEPATVETALAGRAEQVAGLLHCASLLPPATGDDSPEALFAQTVQSAEALYAILAATGASLSERADGVVLAVSQMGGAFTFDGHTGAAPGAAGAAGLLKTLSKEWTQAQVRALDLEPGCAVEEAATLIFEEAGRRDGRVEIGWTDGSRWQLLAEPRPLELHEEPLDQSVLTKDSVVFVTGGARGITARCLLWLAQKYHCKFVLAGSSPAPVGEELPETAAISEPALLRAHLAKAAAASGQRPAIVEIERQTRALLKAREIRETLAAFEAAGASAEYYACDVRDGAALKALVDQIYDLHGRIDGAVHGAGIIEDQLVLNKTLESFRRVVTTKAQSAFHLAHALRADGLKFLVFFTSVAGRFGNRGQGDYGAANEIVSKFARNLDANWPGRVVAISWGPWDSDGMVSDEIKAQFEALGIEAVPPAIGIRAMEAEILTEVDQVPEVVWGLGPWEHDMSSGTAQKPVKAAE